MPPKGVVIASQVELRFLEPGNKYERFDTPCSAAFHRLSNYFNKWLNKQKCKDRMLCIRGKNKLDDPSFYRDSVHLNDAGLLKLYKIIKQVAVDTFHKSDV